MTESRQQTVSAGRTAARICCAAALTMLVGAAHAQAPQNPAEPRPDAGATATPGYRPGFIDAFGQWIESSVSNWNSGIKGAADAAKGAADVAKGAADVATTVTRDTAGAVVRFPGTRVIAERATCPTAPNGAPDCRAAAEAICKAHGFATGGSIDFQTAEKCPPIAFNRPQGELPPPCVIESYVTRSLCQ
jgi:hypothetical protein